MPELGNSGNSERLARCAALVSRFLRIGIVIYWQQLEPVPVKTGNQIDCTMCLCDYPLYMRFRIVRRLIRWKPYYH